MLTQELIKEYLSYSPETGVFTWIKKPNRSIPIGREAGYINQANTKRYRIITVEGNMSGAHRMAWLYMTGELPEEVDHINGDGTDNRWENLRAADRLSNQKNMRKSTRNTSGVVGVHWHNARSKWAAGIVADGKHYHLGLFADFDEAVTARKEAEVLHGFHPNHGADRPL